jgi:hypothetical protein
MFMASANRALRLLILQRRSLADTIGSLDVLRENKLLYRAVPASTLSLGGSAR